MLSKERVLAAIERRPADRIPIYDSFWLDTVARWRQEGLSEVVSVQDYFGFDIHVMGIDASPRFKPELLETDGEMVTIRDRFGYVVKKEKNKSRTMMYLSHPAESQEQWESVKRGFNIDPDGPARVAKDPFPFKLEMGDSWQKVYEDYCDLLESGKYILGSAYGPHEAILRLHGFEKTLYSLCDSPGMLTDMAETYSNFLLQVINESLEKGVRFDGLFLVEDLAATNGMLFSPDQWRNIFKPSMAKIGEFLASNDLHFWMHCCGNAEPVFGDLIECGVQVLNPLEAKSGLDVCWLKDKYGEDLTFFGNIDAIKMSGTDEEIEEELQRKVTAAKQGGGYIYHSDHSVPPEVSWGRYKHIMEMVSKYGKY
ncbi:methylcobalamin:coenzyme M methyltransferase [Anaerohalosphaera lusitana]|uniref:Methylcobalamin:coenzyme M methyltransferase n=1 Tax=Anaerohalosphaera lusitana TaxID=1936003 RepID=A0A1U9NL65_9BACT|nr:uroporphyrinogen decarboxylase family protein [Anaerohalosphaera lusitana]AQT68682.1 methylcobalamin:coenzyme M methyltransferase [Anaerohalosphaera lusitana]